ncbi:hypothetical protein PENSOL_c075G00878 [Penicillium solitum]|uniref:Hydrophobin n=1 Tax=Penicillium solitum TaxID=60172 RepID=A0A1V6QFD3_9EURO|nr:uncharacterized protein PENSOL_c075G00878 [Penicillium solitum]OQD87928.1 hypothetical protein PENSOL_c075G00878 [Penicillium solitum]
MRLEIIILAAAVGALASPLTDRQTSITCSSSSQTPKCCQILVPVNILGKTVDIGVGCVNLGSSCKGQLLCCNTENFLIDILNVCTEPSGGSESGGNGGHGGGG